MSRPAPERSVKSEKRKACPVFGVSEKVSGRRWL